MSTTTLYRPVGQAELDLVAAAGWRGFPPRLFWQPIFYPVLTREYAAFIAREWNVRDAASGFVGHVLAFDVRDDHLTGYDVQEAGGPDFREYWIPAGELHAFNAAIVGLIRLVDSFGGAPEA